MAVDPRLRQLEVLPDPSGLLAAIILNPDEDVPRLEYADWLDEHTEDHDRAELIRLSVAVVRRVGERWLEYADWADDCRRVEKMVRKLRDAICYPRAGVMRVLVPLIPTKDLHFERGFLDRVETTWGRWLRGGDALREKEWVPRVRLTDGPVISELNVGKKNVTFRLGGRRKRVLKATGDVILDAKTATEMLEIEWPGTVFVVPGIETVSSTSVE